MAIIKNGRINIWNAVKKQFEVVHPETETARITDFADGIVQKLALTSAMTAVTALQTDSWFGKLLKMALTASGVRYNIADNGYICFGSFFGGLIIQWGETPVPSGYCAVATLPITAKTLIAVGIGSNIASDPNYIKNVLRLADLDTTSRICFRTSGKESPSVFYIAICR